MRAQRVREGESRVEKQFTKWTAEGAVKGWRLQIRLSILRRRAYVSCREYKGIPHKSTVPAVNQGGTAGGQVYHRVHSRP